MLLLFFLAFSIISLFNVSPRRKLTFSTPEPTQAKIATSFRGIVTKHCEFIEDNHGHWDLIDLRKLPLKFNFETLKHQTVREYFAGCEKQLQGCLSCVKISTKTRAKQIILHDNNAIFSGEVRPLDPKNDVVLRQSENEEIFLTTTATWTGGGKLDNPSEIFISSRGGNDVSAILVIHKKLLLKSGEVILLSTSVVAIPESDAELSGVVEKLEEGKLLNPTNVEEEFGERSYTYEMKSVNELIRNRFWSHLAQALDETDLVLRSISAP